MAFKNYLAFSIFSVFLLSLMSLLFALLLSWEGKENTGYFLMASLTLAVLGSVLCTNKKITFTEVVKLVEVFRK